MIWRKRIGDHDTHPEPHAKRRLDGGFRCVGFLPGPDEDAMPEPIHGDVTTLLREVNAGQQDAFARLMAVVYPQLRLLARSHFRHERSGHVLQPTAVVNEAYLRLVAHEDHNWQNRAHFFGAASQLMRRILVDHARAQHAQKRDGGQIAMSLDQDIAAVEDDVVDVIALDEALDALERLSVRQAQVVQLRYFGGLTVPEIAATLRTTARTVDRDWATARAWLRLRLRP
jgi:RNA polymerase sigma-70 factor (ECF subfamily)